MGFKAKQYLFYELLRHKTQNGHTDNILGEAFLWLD